MDLLINYRLFRHERQMQSVRVGIMQFQRQLQISVILKQFFAPQVYRFLDTSAEQRYLLDN